MTDGARVIKIPPPAYYGVAFALSSLIPRMPIGAPKIAGAIVLALGVAIALAGVITVVRSHTTIVPHAAVSTLVTHGIYRITRNPMYTGLALAYLGGALLVDSWWTVIVFPVVILIVRFVVIAPEERYLADKFGETYAAYCAKVRRWL